MFHRPLASARLFCQSTYKHSKKHILSEILIPDKSLFSHRQICLMIRQIAAVSPKNNVSDNSNLLKRYVSCSIILKYSEEKEASGNEQPTSEKPVEPPIVPPKKRLRVDLTSTSLERNFITPVRAMSDFLLKPSDLEVFIFFRALEVWKTKEALERELAKIEKEKKKYQQSIFTVKQVLKDIRREQYRKNHREAGLFGPSGRVVLTAVVINASNFLFKMFAWLYTGSHSMFAESIHSLADTINQLILAYGIHKSVQDADLNHPYGYSNMKYVASLISGVGIFCVGTGLSIYHGITGLLHPAPMESFYW
ncbi:hypothetical protein J437_LFUL018418, partial [Ladona fulva]